MPALLDAEAVGKKHSWWDRNQKRKSIPELSEAGRCYKEEVCLGKLGRLEERTYTKASPILRGVRRANFAPFGLRVLAWLFLSEMRVHLRTRNWLQPCVRLSERSMHEPELSGLEHTRRATIIITYVSGQLGEVNKNLIFPQRYAKVFS